MPTFTASRANHINNDNNNNDNNNNDNDNMKKSDSSSAEAFSVRIKVLLLALLLWLGLSLPSITMTMILNGASMDPTNKTDELVKPDEDFSCYENFTVYHPVFVAAQFWIEGVLLIGVGIFGICGNCLTLVVLSKSKNSSFHQVSLGSNPVYIEI